MAVYSSKLVEAIKNIDSFGSLAKPAAAGKAVNIRCASFVKFELMIEREAGKMIDAKFTSNGCGFMIAAADGIVRSVKDKRLADLHGIDEAAFLEEFRTEIGELPAERADCFAAAVEALKKALSTYRQSIVEEFIGETALICTCFGVTEDRILDLIEKNGITETSRITDITNAGSGCGSCLMLIDEIISTGK